MKILTKNMLFFMAAVFAVFDRAMAKTCFRQMGTSASTNSAYTSSESACTTWCHSSGQVSGTGTGTIRTLVNTSTTACVCQQVVNECATYFVSGYTESVSNSKISCTKSVTCNCKDYRTSCSGKVQTLYSNGDCCAGNSSYDPETDCSFSSSRLRCCNGMWGAAPDNGGSQCNDCPEGGTSDPIVTDNILQTGCYRNVWSGTDTMGAWNVEIPGTNLCVWAA